MKRLAVLVLLTLSCSCVGGTYVAADRATFQAIEPEYRAYVNMDVNLTTEQKDRRFRTLDTWRVRIEAAEGRK